MVDSTPAPVGSTTTIDCFGDSLTAGSGGSGQTLSSVLSSLLPGRLVNNWGIPGQTSDQIAARQGGKPVTLNITGGQLPASFATAVVVPSTLLLSTPADNTTRYLSGTINGTPATLIRAATGGPPSTTESYTIMAAGTPSAVTVPSWAQFIPDQGFNARESIQTLWLGRNDTVRTGLPALVAACAAQMTQPRRYVVIGVLPSLEETTGSGASRTSIDTANTALAAAHGDLFVPATPPTVAEMAAISYTPSGQDNTDIAAGVFPTGMRSDGSAPHIHLTGPGYEIFARRVKAVIDAKGW